MTTEHLIADIRAMNLTTEQQEQLFNLLFLLIPLSEDNIWDMMLKAEAVV